ncbi:MAG TPA: ankyrin repeat domain-containing protein [Vicinamibacterales bacterium]|nr:ankyrin repeat domain-containing protein [Vicinamibacterales bacterium]
METRRRLAAIVAFSGLTAFAGLAEQAGPPTVEAARRGDIEAIRALVQAGADVNATQGDGLTPLHWAAERGDRALAEVLLHAGANVRAVTRIGDHTPLHVASRTGSASVVRVLLDAGADASQATTTSGVTPLHLAAASGSVEAVTALLDKGAAIDAREQAWAQTPLVFAAAANRVEVVRTLLARGADVNAATRSVDLVQHQAQNRTAQQLYRQVLASAVPRGQNPTPSQAQAAVEAVREMFRTGNVPEPDAGATGRGRGGAPAAAPAGGVNEEGPPPAISAKGGLTPLHHAARQGYVDTARALIDGGANVNLRSGDGTPPLLIAIINGQFDVAMLLVANGADPNLHAEGNGVTPLWAAINTQWQPRTRYPQPQQTELQRSTYLDVMRALLDVGADPDARIRMHPWYLVYTGCGNGNCGLTNTVGSTAFWRAAYGTDVEAMRLLVAHGADPNVPTMAPQARGARGGRGAEPAAPAAAGTTGTPDPSGLPTVPFGGPGVFPIHAAAGVEYGEGFAGNAHRHAPEGWMPSLKYLVEELGADVNARDNEGYTPLHHAAARGDNEMILYLVSRGADVTAVSRRGQTTADMANGPVQRVSPFPDTIALLEKLGSKNNHRCLSC